MNGISEEEKKRLAEEKVVELITMARNICQEHKMTIVASLFKRSTQEGRNGFEVATALGLYGKPYEDIPDRAMQVAMIATGAAALQEVAMADMLGKTAELAYSVLLKGGEDGEVVEAAECVDEQAEPGNG